MNFNNKTFEIAMTNVVRLGKFYGASENLLQFFYRNSAKLVMLLALNATGGAINKSEVYLFNHCLNTERTSSEITKALISFLGSPDNFPEMQHRITAFFKGEDSIIKCIINIWINNPRLVSKEEIENTINSVLDCFFTWSDMWKHVAAMNQRNRDFDSARLEYMLNQIDVFVNPSRVKLTRENKKRYKEMQREAKRFC